MQTEIGSKFGREIDSFFLLSVMNVVFSSIAMGLSIALSVTSLVTAIKAIADGYAIVVGEIYLVFPPQIILVGLGIVTAIVSGKWLIASSEILSDVDEMKDEYKESLKAGGEDAITSLIVRAMAYYRERKATIGRLCMISRLGGACFFASAAIQAINGAIQLYGAWDPAGALLVVVSVLLSLGLGIAGFLTPRFFSRYTMTWDQRIRGGERAEGELIRLLEGGSN
uniref:Uncharacterized protein n=1 Tax=Candidatus Methanomethylicus mesodigestus TaxID=1867258 RepID=A0A7C3J1T7_9CREN